MRKYPIGLQDFRGIREGGFLYVDKTRLIHTLVESGKYYFLSRPRRFGKSLLLSTIKEIVSGSKELFKGLWIEDQWNWQQKHPVIHISFASIGVRTLGLTQAIFGSLAENAERLGVSLEKTTIDQQFRELIRKASVVGKVVVLIDEYDKPIIDYLDDIPLAQQNRAVFKSFYSVLKDSDEYIRLLFITGVSKFTKVSIFSDLNNLQDITLSPQYATLTGITQAELRSDFAPEIQEMQQINPAILDNIKNWYNGYSWNGVDRVYNPFSLLNFMSDRQFRNYWFATGTPTFLVEQIKKKGEFKFEGRRMGELALGNFNIEHIDPTPLLFQTGYLTIKSYDPQLLTYELDYPNKEVESSLLDALLSAYRDAFPGDSMALTGDLGVALQANDIPGVMELLNALISTIPYDHWRADSESIFHIIFHLTFKKIGVNIQSEVHSSIGRCDVLIQTATHIYAIELKLNATAQIALDQVFEKGYLRPYQSDKRQKVAIGVNFSSEDRKVKDFLVKEIGEA
jgi:hypothetical protein